MKNNALLPEVASIWGNLTRSQKWLYFLYSVVLIPHIGEIFRAIFNRVGLSFVSEYTDAFLVVIALLFCLPLIIKNNKPADYIFILVVAVWHEVSALLFPETAIFSVENTYYFFVLSLPLYFIGRTMDSQTSIKLFVLLSYIALILELLFLYFWGMEVDAYGNERTRMMTRAYTFLPFALFLLWYAFEHANLWNYFMALFSVFLIFSFGTRGPVLCLVFFVVMYILVFKSFKHNLLIKTIIVGLGAAFYTFSVPILLFFSMLSSSVGLSTRVFDSILNDQMTNITESSGRDDIFRTIWDYLSYNHVYFNAEFYADRIATGEGIYAHNLEAELLCDFGIIGGSMVLLLLLAYILKAFYNSWKTNGVILLFVFFCSSVMQLQFSGSFLQTNIFWLFLGMCVAMVATPRKRNKVCL